MSGASDRYAITVRFQLRAGTEDRFLALVKENAAASVREEPDCLLFDVLVPIAAAEEPYVLLYEIYTSRAALDHHVTTEHYRAFDAATRAMVTRKEVQEFTLHANRSRR